MHFYFVVIKMQRFKNNYKIGQWYGVVDTHVYNVVTIEQNSKKRRYWSKIIHSKIVSMIRKYHNHKLQIDPWYREEESHNNHEDKAKQSALSSPSRCLQS